MKRASFIRHHLSSKIKCICLVFIMCFIVNTNIYSQDEYKREIDSLQNILSEASGENKLDVYMENISNYNTYIENDYIFNLYDEYIAEASKQKNAKHETYARANKLNLLFNYNRFDEFIAEVYPCLELAKENSFWQNYYIAYQTLLEVFLAQGEYEKSISGAKELYEVAKQNQHIQGMSSASYSIALAYQQTNRWEDAEKYYRQTIDLEQELKVNLRYTMFDAYYGLCEVLTEQKKFDEAYLFLSEWEEKQKEKEEAIQATPDRVAWYGYYIISARVNTEAGNYAEAEKYCNLAESQLPEVERALINVHYYRARVYEAYGKYERAVEEAGKAELYCRNANETNFLQEVLSLKLRILTLMSGQEEIPILLESITHIKDSIRNIDINADLDELRTIYEVDKLENEKEIRRQQLIIAIGGCGLLLLALLIFIVYSRRLAKKNHILYNQVQELNSKEKAVEQCLITRPEEGLTKEMQLFRKLSKVMRIENYFTNPDLSRKKLADILGTNEMYLADAIKAGSGYTYSEYISNIRLQHALEILNNKPEVTLDIVAIDSGHGSYSQFFRSFSKKYGISPSEYRKLSADKKMC